MYYFVTVIWDTHAHAGGGGVGQYAVIFNFKSGGAHSYRVNLKGRSRCLETSISKNTLFIAFRLRKYPNAVLERLRQFKLRLLYGLIFGFTLRSVLRLGRAVA